MAKTLGYLITWTTYGTWLQGDERGYVKKGRTLPEDEKLSKANKEFQSSGTVRLSPQQKSLVHDAIIKEAKTIGQRLLALVVCSNHIHLVVEYTSRPIAEIVAYYKNAARLALKTTGHTGRLWTKGYDKRFCFDRIILERRIKYIQHHNPT